jgi:hypothetical protein
VTLLAGGAGSEKLIGNAERDHSMHSGAVHRLAE